MQKRFRELSDLMIMLGGFSTGVSCALSVRLHRFVDDWPFWPPILIAVLFYCLHALFRRRERRILVRLTSTTEITAEERPQSFHAFNCSYHTNRICNCADKPWP